MLFVLSVAVRSYGFIISLQPLGAEAVQFSRKREDSEGARVRDRGRLPCRGLIYQPRYVAPKARSCNAV